MSNKIVERLKREIKERDERIRQLELALAVGKQNIFQYCNPSLKLLRIANNMTLEEASKQLDITTATLSKFENGSATPSKAMLVLMGKIYNFPDEHIFTVCEPKGSKNEK